jgi:hypothetical protein
VTGAAMPQSASNRKSTFFSSAAPSNSNRERRNDDRSHHPSHERGDALWERRRRRSDGAVFAVATLTDRDRLENRTWTAFANDLQIIERLEQLRVNEPLAVTGPFTALPNADGSGVIWRITIEAMLDARRPKKGKKLIAREERVLSDEADDAPTAPEHPEGVLDDLLPW